MGTEFSAGDRADRCCGETKGWEGTSWEDEELGVTLWTLPGRQKQRPMSVAQTAVM